MRNNASLDAAEVATTTTTKVDGFTANEIIAHIRNCFTIFIHKS